MTTPETDSADGRLAALDDRLAALSARLADLRRESQDLYEQARHATDHALELRTRAPGACRHADQAREMQASVAEMQHELEGLRTAMETRGVIEQAKGMLMMSRHCDADEAFAYLIHLSQTSHRKLVDVARAMVKAWAVGDRAPA